jgi:hypothetical protein
MITVWVSRETYDFLERRHQSVVIWTAQETYVGEFLPGRHLFEVDINVPV